jgi:hypothetical protein
MNRKSKHCKFKPPSAPIFGIKPLFVILAVLFSAPEVRELRAQTAPLDLFISSRNTNSVKRYHGQTGAYLGDFVKPGAGGLNTTQEVLFGMDGHLLVSGRGNKHILKFDRDTGDFLGNFTSGYDLDNPTKMTLGPDNLLYISQWGQQKKKVVRFNFATGAFVDEFTEIDLNQGCGQAWDAAGNLYVASFGSADVRKFDQQGKFLGVFTEAGHLQGAVNLWFGEGGDLFVVDWTLGAVLRFDGQNGRFKSNFITGMQNTEGFVFGPDSTIYLCDWSRNTVNRYDRSGRFLGVFTNSGDLRAPNSVVFGPPPVTTVTERESQPLGFALHQNYPNPFSANGHGTFGNSATRIAFELPAVSRVSLKIYDVNGRVVTTLVGNQEMPAGTHYVNFSGKAWASGIYYYRLEATPSREKATAFSKTKAMLLVK